MELVSFAHAPIYAKISPHVDLVKLQDASDGWCVKAQASDTSPGNQIMFKKGDIVIEIDPLAACVNGVKPQENSVMELVCAGCCRHDLESRSTLKRCGGCSVSHDYNFVFAIFCKQPATSCLFCGIRLRTFARMLAKNVFGICTTNTSAGTGKSSREKM